MQADLAEKKANIASLNEEQAKAEIALTSTMSKAEFAAEKDKRTKELEGLRANRKRIEAQIEKARKERDAALKEKYEALQKQEESEAPVDAPPRDPTKPRVSFSKDTKEGKQ